MRKRVFGRKLKRTTNQRKALFRSLTQALVLHGRIKTTEAKAKSIKGEVERLITKAKNNPATAMSVITRHVSRKTAAGIIAIAPVFANRPGGYTRIVRLGGRQKDNASMVILEFVDKTDSTIVEVPKEKKPAKSMVGKEVLAGTETPKKAAVKKAPAKTKKTK